MQLQWVYFDLPADERDRDMAHTQPGWQQKVCGCFQKLSICESSPEEALRVSTLFELNSNPSGWFGCTCPCCLACKNAQELDRSGCLHFCLSLFPLLTSISACTLRSEARRKFNIRVRGFSTKTEHEMMMMVMVMMMM